MSASHRALTRLLAVDGLALLATAVLAPAADVAAPLDARWWARATTTDLTITLGWWAATVVACWVAATTLTCLASRAVPALTALRVLDRVTAPVVRRAVDAALACSVTVGVVASGASAAGAAPARATASATTTTAPTALVQVMPDGRVVIAPASPSTAAPPRRPSTTTSTTTPATTTTSVAAMPSPTPPPPHAPARGAPTSPRRATSTAQPRAGAPAAPVRATVHVVVAGDNLWRIATARLADAFGRSPVDAEVLPYWRRVVDANRSTLRSGDPNLIFPGEIVALPPA
jgi:nucleoid-associated protein YgaU